MKRYRLTTTLKLLQQHKACAPGYRKLLKSLSSGWPGDKPINLLQVLRSNGVQDMCWCLRATVEDSVIPRVLMAADFAQSVLKHFTARFPNDDRPAKAIKAARDFAAGKVGVSYAVYAASAAAASAAYCAATAGAAAEDAAYAASAAYAAANVPVSADAANAAYCAAYCATTTKKERAKQARIIRKYLK